MILSILSFSIAVVSMLLFVYRKKIDTFLLRRRNINRQKKQLDKMSEEQKKTIRGLKDLATFVDWLNKQFANRKQKKTFWHEFMDNQYRQVWFEKLFKQLESKSLEIEKKKKSLSNRTSVKPKININKAEKKEIKK